jgi:hypothetical protein
VKELHTSADLDPDAPTLRRATTVDALTVTQITADAYEKYIAAMGRKPCPMLADYAVLIDTDWVWLVTLGGNVAGVAQDAIWQRGFLERMSTGLYLLQLGITAESRAMLSVAAMWAHIM